MRTARIGVVAICALTCGVVCAQEKNDGPTNEKAQKTYQEALRYLHNREKLQALEGFKKADKQDGGHCVACQKQVIKFGMELEDWKAAESAAQEMVAEAQGDRGAALAHYQFATVLMTEGMVRKKDEYLGRAHEEIGRAIAAFANFPDALFIDGQLLARLQQDEAAKVRFAQFVKMTAANDPNHGRALRYISRPELARAKMSPAFSVTTMDGKQVSMDELQGKVVLLDFWATWCEPCREAMPHIRKVAKKFEGQPLVILSVSLDSDEQKWKEFVGKNEMTWPQYRDGGFTGPIATMFGVKSIPHTYTIDVDGVLQEEHIGDSSVEGKLKKLLERAREMQSQDKGTPLADAAAKKLTTQD
jgi:thiol-disulfide isomerase/thioredoxin